MTVPRTWVPVKLVCRAFTAELSQTSNLNDLAMEKEDLTNASPTSRAVTIAPLLIFADCASLSLPPPHY